MDIRNSDTPVHGPQRSGKKGKLPLSFQDEREIIDLVADIDNGDVCFFPRETKRGLRFLSSLRARSFDQRESPDFEDVSASLLLEAMIVDDHPRNAKGKKDVTRARQSEVRRELLDAGWDQLAPNATLFANVSSGLPTDLDHNYRAYVEHFTRTVTAFEVTDEDELRKAPISGAGLSKRPSCSLDTRSCSLCRRSVRTSLATTRQQHG